MATKRKPASHDRRRHDESWLKTHWRPMMAWSYFAICLFDFLAAPIFFAWFSWFTKTAMQQWVPLTLQGGGLYHLAMGAIIGVTSYQRSQEKINTQSPTGMGQYGGNNMGGGHGGNYGGNSYGNSYSQPYQPTQQYQPQQTKPIAVKPKQTTQIAPTSEDPEL